MLIRLIYYGYFAISFLQVENGKAQAANYPFCTIEPNVGIVGVPDPRLHVLSDLSKSQRAVPASIEFVDIAGLVKGASQGEVGILGFFTGTDVSWCQSNGVLDTLDSLTFCCSDVMDVNSVNLFDCRVWVINSCRIFVKLTPFFRFLYPYVPISSCVVECRNFIDGCTISLLS